MSVNLKDWLSSNQNLEKRQKLFYNMSRTMNYIHDKDYCIKNFNPKEIEILNTETLNPIKYNTVVRIPKEERTEIIHKDIYNLAFIQISTYSNIDLVNLKPKFLKENFNQFKFILPESDIPYLQGIIERNSSVYYYQYVDEKNRREIEKLNKEYSDSGLGNSDNLSIKKTKATNVGRAIADKETKNLYTDLVDRQQAAFVSFLIFPISFILLGIVLAISLIIYG